MRKKKIGGDTDVFKYNLFETQLIKYTIPFKLEDRESPRREVRVNILLRDASI